jgi:hypothetical protein
MKLPYAQIAQAVNSFKEFHVAHRLQTETLDRVLFELQLCPNTAIVTLIGPTGIGKTALQRLVIDALVAEHRDEMARDPTFRPVIRTSAMASGWRLYDWKTLYVDALTALGDPFVEVRNVPWKKSDTAIDLHKLAGESRTAAALRLHLEKEFKQRRTRYWLIDEAAHVLFGGKGGSPGDQFDVLKSICERTGVKLLLSGPREIEDQVSHSGQLARRRSTVRYPRYRPTKGDVGVFASVAETLLSSMKLEGYPAVRETAAMLYGGSAGCVGILKDWLARAFGMALREPGTGARVLTLDHLRSTRLPPSDMETI